MMNLTSQTIDVYRAKLPELKTTDLVGVDDMGLVFIAKTGVVPKRDGFQFLELYKLELDGIPITVYTCYKNEIFGQG